MTFMQVGDKAGYSIAELRMRAEGVLTPPNQHLTEGDGTSLRHDFELDPELANLDGTYQKRLAGCSRADHRAGQPSLCSVYTKD